jgi:hypothetical protein
LQTLDRIAASFRGVGRVRFLRKMIVLTVAIPKLSNLTKTNFQKKKLWTPFCRGIFVGTFLSKHFVDLFLSSKVAEGWQPFISEILFLARTKIFVRKMERRDFHRNVFKVLTEFLKSFRSFGRIFRSFGRNFYMFFEVLTEFLKRFRSFGRNLYTFFEVLTEILKRFSEF